MAEPKIWHPGDPCANCGGVVALVPLPTDDERAAAADILNLVPIPLNKDTAPAKFVDEFGRLYRCPVDGFSVRSKDPAPVDPSHAALGGLMASDASLKAALDTQTARVDALRTELDALKAAHAAAVAAAAPPAPASGA